MDVAGKDGTIKHVISSVNPQDCRVESFRQPSTEELKYDFLWQCTKVLPDLGSISIFNRSHDEDDLVTYQKVYGEVLNAPSTPWAPWCVVPATRKYALRALVGGIIVDAIDRLDLESPNLGSALRTIQQQAKAELLAA
jgi:polyphosphate kinase 2 (PPK2 family)